MEIIIILFIIVFVIYKLNSAGQKRWKKHIAEFLLHVPSDDYANMCFEISLLTTKVIGIQKSLAIGYIHVVSALIASSAKATPKERDKINVLSNINSDFGLGQLFYKNYINTVNNLDLEGIGCVPLDFYEFKDQVNKSIVGVSNAISR